MELVVSNESFATNLEVQATWAQLSGVAKDLVGVAYFQHPVIGAVHVRPPDICCLMRSHQPLVVKALAASLEQIESVGPEHWVVNGSQVDSPLLELEDYLEMLAPRFRQRRELRSVFSPKHVLALPNIDRGSFKRRFEAFDLSNLLFRDDHPDTAFVRLAADLDDRRWALARAIFQSPAFARGSLALDSGTATTIGDAIKRLEDDILLLDQEQEKVAVQLPAGPQCIHGLAGTGKTVLLAMKAANLHLHFPNKRILFTFFTQSLYDNVTDLITRYYSANTNGEEPNWKQLHVRHAWGGQRRAGVYYDVCVQQRAAALNFREAKLRRPKNPFEACAEHALSLKPEPIYDYVLVDEGQDLPTDFFRLLYALSTEPHAIYWAFDEIQNLTSIAMPAPSELFGVDDSGRPLVSLDGEYPGGIDKDLALQKSYRCPGRVLMLAHAIGLGLYRPRGCVQILPDVDSWQSVGYEVEKGPLKQGESVTIFRPPENSPNRVEQHYSGDEKVVSVTRYDRRRDELEGIVTRIWKDINEQNVPPEKIVVVTLNPLDAKEDLAVLQSMLFERGIQSIAPGVLSENAHFIVPGMVTLASVYRAKGNEAAVVYVIACEVTYSYLDEIEARNKAFTAISRAKGWVRLSGVGENMRKFAAEVDKVEADYPRFKFTFPDPSVIRKLRSETTRRREAAKKADRSIDALLSSDRDALSALDPDKLKKMAALITEAINESE
jgi:superfamily I DNA and RNA helicase